MSWVLAAACSLAALAHFPKVAEAQSGGAFEISWSTISCGGTEVQTGDGFSLASTVGQPAVGETSGDGFGLSGGFWLGGGLAVGVAEPDTSLTPGGSDPDSVRTPASLPTAYRVLAPAPNPFRDRTRIGLELPAASAVRVEVTDVAGRLVRVLVDASLPAGRHSVAWDGRDDGGHSIGSGVYFVRVLKPGSIHTQKIVRVEGGK
ncbi:MAG: FlgD immunoglobulin-like domain containing protein [Candidatus Eisenbacteria bacterium]